MIKKTLSGKLNSDVVIVGAGFSGVSAAVAAARRGARVTLIEKEAVPGGTALGLRHRFLCGLFPNAETFPRNYLNPGLTEEVCKRLAPRAKPLRMGKVWLLTYDPDQLSDTLGKFLAIEKNINFLNSSTFLSTSCQGGRIKSVTYSRQGKVSSLQGAVYIDAGAGCLVKECRAAQSLSLSKRQMPGYALELSGVPWDDALPIRVPYALYQAVLRKELPLYTRWTVVTAGEKKGRVFLKLSLPVGSALSLAQEVAGEVVKTLRQDLPAFRSAKVVWQAGQVFLRDGVQLCGEYVIKNKDVETGKKFDDGIVKGAWPMEFWDPKRGPTYIYCEKDHYELPERSLMAKDVSNLLAAGRSVSAEPGALASFRVGGLCIATGEAAGHAAVEYLNKT